MTKEDNASTLLERITGTSQAAKDTPGGTDYCSHLKWRKYQNLPIFPGYLLTVRLCAFEGTCESPIENEQETDEFPEHPQIFPLFSTALQWMAC